jgi:riboflavin synthase
MFSGIVEGTGTVLKITQKGKGTRLKIRAPFALASTKIGDSVAVNGCCLTVAAKRGNLFEADLSSETLRVTGLGKLKGGDSVNLERPLRLVDRIGGHLVQGHVDGLGRILNLRRNGSSLEIEIGFPKNLRRYLIPKGSIAVDGISMTVNRLTEKSFTLVVIPHTLRRTNLRSKRVGNPVNLEVDMIGKYVESLMRK